MNLLETYLSKTYNTDKNTAHCYIEKLYNQLFDNSNISSLLEIGALHGGSALLWRDYFINANIEILDIHTRNDLLNQKRIIHRTCDAYTIETIQKLNTYDIIIDDGPHTLSSMIFFVEHYLNLLNQNGIAIIEDIQDYNFFEEIISKIPQGFTSEKIDLRPVKNRYDDMLLVIRKI